jgi:hypothetical protein
MRRTVIHPYFGFLVACGRHDGLQHDCDPDKELSVTTDVCDQCGQTLAVCADCRYVISCCRCGAYHSVDCEWPL